MDKKFIEIIKRKYDEEFGDKFSFLQILTFLFLCLVVDVLFQRGMSLYEYISSVSLHGLGSKDSGYVAIKLSSVLWAIGLYVLIRYLYIYLFRKALILFLSKQDIENIVNSISERLKKYNSNQIPPAFLDMINKDVESARNIIESNARITEALFFLVAMLALSLVFEFSFSSSTLIELFLCFLFAGLLAYKCWKAMLYFVSKYIPALLYQKQLINKGKSIEDSFIEIL